MKTSDFNFELPDELIAQTPLKDRTSSRLLVVDKNTGDIQHKNFFNITDHIKKGDCLVINNTRVLPARLYGQKINLSPQKNQNNVGASIEILLLQRKDISTWEVIMRNAKKCKIGDKINFGDGKLIAEVIEILEEGNRLIKFEFDGVFENILDELGEMPLPPYITERLQDKERYQTVYSKEDGSSAAPTAGLHFTEQLLNDIKNMGVHIAYVTLHVGLGTFRPVKVDNVLEHHMHSEYYTVEQSQADIINDVKKNGGRVFSVGTTSTRTLESVADENGIVQAKNGFTDIFIYPPYEFKVVDCLITNFHLPESTLIMLVSALAGKDLTMKAYDIAVNEKYRFFSFGDACLFLTK